MSDMNNSTQYCFIENKKYNINDFIKDNKILKKYKNGEIKIYDCDKNELIFANGKKIKPYFRKLVLCDNPMTEWHKIWQYMFEGYTEQIYKSKDMIKKYRRTDVDLNDKQIIEFQYSRICKKDVSDRQSDYYKHNKEIIWVVYGGNTIEVTELSHSNRIFLEFITETWKYESFIDYDYIYLDICDKIYKINPKSVKSDMIDVQMYITKEIFYTALKDNKDPFEKVDIYQTRIFVRQQGAGNGKTYGIVQLIEDDKFNHYDTFVYLTKQHSAVHVIKKEIDKHIENGWLKSIKITDDDIISKKHIINYINTKTNKKCKIIVGTVDSFVWALGNQNLKGVDKFMIMINSIINEDVYTKISDKGYVKYAGGVIFDKNMLLIGDEMQDLHENYMKAIIKITRDWYVDFYAVGDKLQSISIENNAFTYLLKENLQLPNTILPELPIETNVCRRFCNNDLIEFVNAMIPFKIKFNLPCITKNPLEIDNNTDSLTVFDGKTIYPNELSDTIVHEVEKIMKYYIKEVDDNNCLPKDFLIVTPYVSKNPLVEALHMAITEFWKERYNDKLCTTYSVFHKSVEGICIDLSKSDKATRIVSIHSSKGDGRNVVFVIGLTEEVLKLYSKYTDNLIYNSLLHVALTRMKKKLYIRLEKNGDDIYHRYIKYIENTGKICTMSPELIISNKLDFTKIIKDSQTKTDIFNICYENIIKYTEYTDLKENIEDKDKKIIDMGHHNTRFAIFITLIMIEIINHKQKNDKQYKQQQLYQKLKNCLEYEIIMCNSVKQYNTIINNKDKIFPILAYKNDEGLYSDNYNKLIKIIDCIRAKISDLINKNKNIELNNALESICFYFMMCMCDKFKNCSLLPISDMYDIINIYNTEKSESSDEYIKEHYNKIIHVKKIYTNLCKKYKNLKWLVNQKIYMNGSTFDFTIHKTFNLIAYNSEIFIVFYVKPQFNSMNFNEILLDSIFDEYLIKNVKKENKDGEIYKIYEHIQGKKIMTCVMTFDKDEPYYIDWNNNNDLITKNIKLLNNIIRDNIMSIYISKNNIVHEFYKYWRTFFKKNKPLKIINNIIKEYENIKQKHIYRCDYPKYIDFIFQRIKNKIEFENRGSKYQRIILDEYDDKLFIDDLNNLMTEAIDIFFGISIDDSDTDSDSSIDDN